MRRPFSVNSSHQQAVGCQLEDVRGVRLPGGETGFHFHWDEFTISFDKIIRFANQAQLGIEERFIHPAPRLRIRIDHPSGWKTARLPLLS